MFFTNYKTVKCKIVKTIAKKLIKGNFNQSSYLLEYQDPTWNGLACVFCSITSTVLLWLTAVLLGTWKHSAVPLSLEREMTNNWRLSDYLPNTSSYEWKTVTRKVLPYYLYLLFYLFSSLTFLVCFACVFTSGPKFISSSHQFISRSLYKYHHIG